MNPILEEILVTGNTLTVDGKIKKVNAQISGEEGALIQKCISDIQAEVSIEVGLAFGTSALFICEALRKSSVTKHYVIDPYQMYEESYGGIGLNNLKKAGFGEIIEFIDKPSHLALAMLAERNVKADFAFIDGWHTFDHTLVDFFLIDKLLKIDGIVILDDSDWAAVEKVCSFISKNRSYKFIGGSVQRSHLNKKKDQSLISNPKSFIKNILRNDIDEHKYGAMAFKKVSVDDRRWDHFVNF
ncbi:MAG TPA: class I SAM-dependent methyltransferase [Ignavibacteria bacterium]|nr:class I SAM-dependent methyltransferase [Ignavibacteria bacterium]